MKSNNVKRRALAKKEIGRLYSRIKNHDLGICYYCGDKRECLDHVPPLSIAVDLDLDQFRKKGGRLLLVPSCGQCNSLLGAKRLGSICERVNLLWNAYARLIERTDHRWSQEEMDELGRNLRGVVEAGARKSREYIRKLRGIEYRLLSDDS